MTKLYLHY